jgi:hypothetical protein
VNDDGLRRRLRDWLDAQVADRHFADRALGAAVSAPRRTRRVASLALGMGVGLALAGVLTVALTHRGSSVPSVASHARATASPSATATVTPSTSAATSATPTASAPAVIVSAAPTTSPRTSPPPVPALGVRSDPAMAYDPSNNTVLLYGGQRSTSPSNTVTDLQDTWRWDGARWTNLNASAAPALSPVAMAYDMASNQMVLVGATTGGNGDAATFVWNGTAWLKMPTASPPATFFSASMVYDSQSRRLMLLTSGVTQPGSYTAANRLYAWDGLQWTLLWTSPSGTVTTYEPRLLVQLPSSPGWAGLGLDSHTTSDSSQPGAIYTFVGSTWQEADVPGTPGALAAAVYDPGLQRVVVLGGDYRPIPDTGPNITHTYLYNGAAWTSSPLPQALVNRVGEGIAFDKAGGDVIITGGAIGQGFVGTPPPPPPTDTWGWSGSSWVIRSR